MLHPRSDSRPARWVVCIASICLGAALLGCDDRPSSSDCEALLERVIELEMDSAGTAHLNPAMKDDLEKQQRELREQLRKPFVEDCEKNMAVDVVKCGLEAKSKSEFADCEEE